MPDALSNSNLGASSYPVRRSTPRKGVAPARQLKARIGGAGEGYILDLSEKGMGLQVPIPLQPGSSLAVDFDLPESGGHVRIDGRVVWATAARRAGVRFERVADLASERLKRWVNQNPTAVEPARESPLNSILAAATGPAEISDEPDSLDTAINQVLARAVTITKASGAAIAIGPPEAMVCRASVGNAPDVGAPIQPNSGLTGYCLRSRETVHCADSETDSRVNAAACREMDVRSVLVIPVLSGKAQDQITGILEVFSSQPQAFTNEHISKLEKLVRILGFVASDMVPDTSEPQISTGNAPTELSNSEAPEKPSVSPVTLPEHTPRKFGDRRQDTQSSVERSPEFSAAVSSMYEFLNQEPKPVHSTEDAVQLPEIRPQAFSAPVITSEIAAKDTALKLAQLAKPEEAKTIVAQAASSGMMRAAAVAPALVPEIEPDGTTLVPTFTIEGPSLIDYLRDWLASIGGRKTRSGRILRVLGVIVIAAEIAAALFLYARWNAKHHVAMKAPPVQAQTVAPPQTLPETPLPSVTESQPEETKPVVKHKKTAETATADTEGADDVVVVNRNGQPIQSTAPAAVPSSTAKASAASEPEPSAPATPVQGENLAALHFPGASVQPSLAPKLSTGTSGGKLIRRVEPIYPDAAKVRRIQGEVVLSARIGTDGSVKGVRAVKGNPVLLGAATQAVKQWRYQPMTLNGTPIEMDTTVTVQFKMPN